MLRDTDLGKGFVTVIPKAQKTKVQSDRGWLYQTRKLHSKGDNTGERQPAEWEKTPASHSADKGLIFRLYKELEQLNSKTSLSHPI